MSVVDTIADDAKLIDAYLTCYDKYMETKRKIAHMKEELEQNQRNADFLQFQFDELTNARLTAGEQEELEQKSDTMSHAEDIKTALYEASQALNADQTGIVSQQRTATGALRGIARVLPAAAELASRMESVHIELKDIAHEVSTLMEDVDFDPAELDAVNLRLDKLYDLQKKYQAESVETLIAKRDDLGRTLQNLENRDEAISELEDQAARQLEDCQREADKLSTVRTKAARLIEEQMRSRLIPLGMPNVRFNVSLEKGQLNRAGQDTVSFLFSANTSTPLQPVSQVASGGEIARVMLSLKAMISGVVKLPTIIFDEIDTGVSGKTAEKMADIMREMGRHGRQVISITHLPQIAALGSTHYRVSKQETATGTVSNMTLLTDEERTAEIAQMLSGSNVTEAALENARQLLKLRHNET
jgi:DNA repair protein RecN (Recombination protein N)